MNSYESIFKEMGESARAASIVLQQLPEKRINEVLCAIADALVQHSEQILIANHMDMDSARGVVPDTMLDRLLLSKERINQMAEGVRQVSLLPSPVGTILETINRPNGLHVEKRAVSFLKRVQMSLLMLAPYALKQLMPLFYAVVRKHTVQIASSYPLCKMY